MAKQDVAGIKQLLDRNIKALNTKDKRDCSPTSSRTLSLLFLEGLLYADTNRLDNTLKRFGRRFQMAPFPSQVRFWPRMQRPLSLCLSARTLVRWPHPMV